ncbi:MAG: ComEC/Rec2 family competence protein [Clostridia bacterium]|nr:ComEC/Rec2 family competence protein [Clostridia bacterium]
MKLSKFDCLYGKTLTIEGTVTEVVWDSGFSGAYLVDADAIEDLPDFSCVLTSGGGIEENSRVRATVVFSPLENDRGFNERRYYLSKNIVIKAEAERIIVTGDAGFSLKSLAGKINSSLSTVFTDLLGGKAGAFASALLLGNDAELSDTVKRDFTRLGISHVLAISGMHLTVLCAFVSAVLSPLGRRASQTGSVIIVLFYMFISGLSASVTRSGIMLLFFIAASIIGKGSDMFTNLGLSGFLICVVDPYSAGDIGLQLSFAAVMAILLYTEKRREPIPERTNVKALSLWQSIPLSIIKSFIEGIILTVIVVLFMLPIEWLYFGEISLVSLLASPLFSVLTTLLLWALPILLVLSPAPTFASLFAYPIEKLIAFICDLANDISLLRGITFSLNFPFAALFCVLICAAVCAFCVTKKKKKLISSAVLLTLCLAFCLSSFLYCCKDRDRTRLTMLSYKSNEGIFLLSDRKAMIVDMGNGYSGIMKEGALALDSTYATEIELLMLTHLHNSYPSTLDAFFSDHMVRTLLAPEGEDFDYEALEEVTKKHVVALSYYSYGDKIEFEDVTLKTSENLYIKRSVQPIVRLDIEAYGHTFTYVGGAYLESIPDAELDCDFIFFGDHGPLYKAEFTPDLFENCHVYAAKKAKSYINTHVSVNEPKTIILEP